MIHRMRLEFARFFQPLCRRSRYLGSRWDRSLDVESLEERQLLTISTALGQVDLWTPAEQPSRASGSYLRAEEFGAFTLDSADLGALLAAAPMEFADATGVQIELPMPTGEMARFEVVEAPVMAPELAAKFPEITTYRGQGLDDPAASVRLDVTPAGFHAQVLSPVGAYYIDPYYHLDDSLYASYFASAATEMPEFHEHEEDELDPTFQVAQQQARAAGAIAAVPRSADAADSSGSELRVYRTAVAATGEYTAFHGGTVPLGMAAIVTAINRVTGIYENELSIRLQLVANNDLLVFTNSATDPYTNGDPSALLNENQSTVDSVIGSANYDIGHVFSTGGGGLATLGVVGFNGLKARGETGLSSPIGDTFYVDYVAHEMGHQFDAQHTFNSVTDNCGGNRTSSAAYEPGSGSTIMAYAGICGSDDLQSHSDPYFHSYSFEQIIDFVDGTIPGVGTRIATGNNIPTIDAGANYTIPAETPFMLTASASDGDVGDVLTYSWEERDLGPSQGVNDGDNGSSPLFRSWTPTTDPTRTFPRMSDLLAGTTAVGETLPTTARTMNFLATVRDNRANGGGVNSDAMTVNVVVTGSPFQVTSPNTAAMLPAQSTQTVTWDVAGTTGGGINTATVDILLSTDGGLTFPTVLASAAPNDGSQDVLLPNVSTTSARIMVRAVGNVFFDVSDVDFPIGTLVAELFNADFSDALGDPFDEGFTVDNSGAPVAGLWHLSTGRGADGGHTADDSFYFGTGEGPAGGGNYDVGDTAGRITSPVISLAGVVSAELSFKYLLQTESGTAFDQALVQISADGGLYQTVLSKTTLSNAGGTFTEATYDLAAYLGSDIRVRFSFDTIDDFSNNFEGWYVDDVIVSGELAQQAPSVTDRHVFYNNSVYDSSTPGPAVSDDGAIDGTKSAYLPGGGMFPIASTTSYSKGINGVMVELTSGHGPITASDFTVKMSGQFVAANNTPSTWTAAPTPTVAVFSDTPVAGTDRVTLVFPDGAITDRYLQVIFEGDDAAGGNNTNTGLAASDIFFFANKIGDTFDNAAFFGTDATDEIGARNHQGFSLTPDNLYDFNKDFSIDATDQIVARNNGGFLPALVFSNPPAAPEPPPGDDGIDAAIAQALAAPVSSTAPKAAASTHLLDRPSADGAFAGRPAGNRAAQLMAGGQARAIDDVLKAFDPDEDALDALLLALRDTA